MEQVAKDLVQTYPSFGDPRKPGQGWEMWFFNSAHGAGATGFLEDRLKNQRKKKGTKKVTSPIEPFEGFLDWNSDCDECKWYLYLKPKLSQILKLKL